jgi:glycosyltransferase involved in cell wall biosynthesis
MKIAVITPYYKESTEVLYQCHQSVLTQNISADHFFIADGFPNEELMKWNVKHISLPQAHADNGNTPRGIGSILADIEGYDFISYLDADNWFHPNHLSSLLNLYQETKADICFSFRTIHTYDGIDLSIQDDDEASLEHIDTSCYFLHRTAFDALDIWLKMPKILSPICDRIFLAGLKHKKYKFAPTKAKTVAFRSQYKSHYLRANIEPPLNAKENVGRVEYDWLLSIAGMKEAVAKLGFVPL